jgi:hypothetical protein
MRNALVAALAITIGAAADLRADPILVQPGSFYSVRNLIAPDGTFDTVGGFFFPSFLPPFGLPIFGREVSNNARTGCPSCAPGDPLNLSASFELRGPSYVPGGPVFRIWGVGTLNFTTPTVVIPLDLPSPHLPFYVFAPFELTGHIELFRQFESVPLFAGDIIGVGRARALLTPSGDSLIFGDNLDYLFASPVPEPATLTLIVTGLAAMGVRRVRRG